MIKKKRRTAKATKQSAKRDKRGVQDSRSSNLKPAELRALNAWLELLPLQFQCRPFAEVGAKTLLEPRFRKRLLANPRRTLTDIGLGFPAHTKLHVMENTARDIYLVLPPTGGIPKPEI